jgi:hypothetical protein
MTKRKQGKKLRLGKKSIRRIDNSGLEKARGGLNNPDMDDGGGGGGSGNTACDTDLCAQYTDTNVSCNFKNATITCCAITYAFSTGRNHNQAQRRR